MKPIDPRLLFELTDIRKVFRRDVRVMEFLSPFGALPKCIENKPRHEIIGWQIAGTENALEFKTTLPLQVGDQFAFAKRAYTVTHVQPAQIDRVAMIRVEARHLAETPTSWRFFDPSMQAWFDQQPPKTAQPA